MKRFDLTITVACGALLALTPAEVWAVASFAKKYEMGCKGCHSFGAELNEVGQQFKKSGYTFGEKNAPAKDKPAPAADGSKAAPEGGDKGGDKKAADKGKGEPTASETAEEPKPVPETVVYRWKAHDGTIVFSDTPEPRAEKQGVPVKPTRKGWGARFGTFVPAAKATPGVAAPKPPRVAVPEMREAEKPHETHVSLAMQPRSYEECMEQILSAQARPANAGEAMEHFMAAENRCASYERNGVR